LDSQVIPKAHFQDYIFTTFLMLMVGNMIWSLCYFGQRLTDQSEELFWLTYECDWYNQSPIFKKKLIIMRIMCLKLLKLQTVKFTLNQETFYKVCLFLFEKSFEFNSIYFLDFQHFIQQLQRVKESCKIKILKAFKSKTSLRFEEIFLC
jgi:hypothetical protein